MISVPSFLAVGHCKALFLSAITHYGHMPNVRSRLDEMQVNLQCCGSESFHDWFDVPWDPQAAALTSGVQVGGTTVWHIRRGILFLKREQQQMQLNSNVGLISLGTLNCEVRTTASSLLQCYLVLSSTSKCRSLFILLVGCMYIQFIITSMILEASQLV